MNDTLAPPETTMHPFERVIEILRQKGGHVRFRSSEQVRATCPAHQPDKKPSLSVKRVERGVVMFCHSGCTPNSVLKALALRQCDLFVGPRPGPQRREVMAVYDYHDRTGAVVARKKRFASKQFLWERPDPTARGGWRSGLDGRGLPGPYRLAELRGASTVFLVEGEKAADRLVGAGAVATCGSGGASTWKPEWSEELLGEVAAAAEVVILPDNDQPGARHGERVAADLVAAGARTGRTSIAVKVVALPEVPTGGDVFDWLDSGRSIDELRALVSATPVWTPEAVARRKAARKSEQARERMRKKRALERGAADATVGRKPGGPDEHALASVLGFLETAESASGRAIKRALAGFFPRAVLERAVARGVQSGVIAETAISFPKGMAYRRRIDIPRVTPAGTLSASVPAPTATDAPMGRAKSGQTPVSRCPVTLFGVTQGERASTPLQETLLGDRHTGVTHHGTLLRDSRIGEHGALETSGTRGAANGDTARPDPIGPVVTLGNEQQRAIAEGRCCGDTPGALPKCKLCKWSPTYWRGQAGDPRGLEASA